MFELRDQKYVDTQTLPPRDAEHVTVTLCPVFMVVLYFADSKHVYYSYI